ncbi:MAG TPA: peptidoglycan-binding protein [Waterburya sp.]|jgi:peptidoglycan hydrolase-like protein with peptidoglycan-binding domain
MAYAFTNAQIRSILNGMGFKKRGTNEANFPISEDNSSLGDALSVQAIKSFQTYFNLTPDGIVGDKTKMAAEKAMNVLHYELDLVMQPNPPLRPQAPLYGPQTAQVVANFRSRYGFEPNGNPNDDRVADLPVRRRLDELTAGRTASV